MENKDDKLKKDGQYIVRQVLQRKRKKTNNKNQEFKVTDEIIEAARLIPDLQWQRRYLYLALSLMRRSK